MNAQSGDIYEEVLQKYHYWMNLRPGRKEKLSSWILGEIGSSRIIGEIWSSSILGEMWSSRILGETWSSRIQV